MTMGNSQQQAHSLLRLGGSYFRQGDYPAALKAYQTGLAQFQHTDAPYWQAGLLSNIAGVYLKQDISGRTGSV